MRDVDEALAVIDAWEVPAPRAIVVTRDGVIGLRGDPQLVGRWASITKLVTALAVLRAVEDGRVDLDEPLGPPGATVRHLLAHASGLPFEGTVPIARPGVTRIYANHGFDLLGDLLAARHGRDVGDVLVTEVLAPIDATATRLVDRPSQGLHGSLEDLGKLAHELLRPAIVRADTLATATAVAFPGLRGVLPGVGAFDPLDWGLGFELRDGKDPHWTGRTNSPSTYGHFGGSGSFLWVDPAAGVALGALTDREFGPWALDAWPTLSDEVLAAAGGPARIGA